MAACSIATMISDNPDCDYPGCIIGDDRCKWGAKPCYLMTEQDKEEWQKTYDAQCKEGKETNF
jgi:Zn-finger protein